MYYKSVFFIADSYIHLSYFIWKTYILTQVNIIYLWTLMSQFSLFSLKILCKKIISLTYWTPLGGRNCFHKTDSCKALSTHSKRNSMPH